MTRSYSPLRYPGGKSQILQQMLTFFNQNSINCGVYAEPYAGGAGLALKLLYDGHIEAIHLNDIDRSIWAFWYSALHHTEALICRIESTGITVKEWRNQKKVQASKQQADVLSLGYSTLFLNRVNRSGIIQKAGVIGGLEQKGDYKIDCRFNKKQVIQKIETIASYKNNIHIHNLDAIDFMKAVDSVVDFFYIDPPYYDKGRMLYTNFYTSKCHANVAKAIFKLKSKWLLSYDNHEVIQKLYSGMNTGHLEVNYSAGKSCKARELLITSPTLKIA